MDGVGVRKERSKVSETEEWEGNTGSMVSKSHSALVQDSAFIHMRSYT